MASRLNGPPKPSLTPRPCIDPDPSSKSGRSVRTIGYSPTAKSLLTIITVTEDGVTYGVNGWQSNETDVKRYRQESP
jgi:hypothetical protein